MPVTVKEVKWGEDNELDAAPVLTDEEQDALKKRMEALDKLLSDQKKGKYKLELMFGRQYKTGQAYPGALSIWESGTKLHGGGDAKVYECPGKTLKKNDCTALIPDASQGYGFLVCPSCKEVWKGTQVHGEILARLTTDGWAKLLYRWWTRVGHNADLYVKRPRRDIRSDARAEQEKSRGGELIEKSRKREVFIYPLRNIIKDVNAGADPLRRFRAFLSA